MTTPPTKVVQRVVCKSCGWSGGRTDKPTVLDRPCFLCGDPVSRLGAPFVESKCWGGCSCGWAGRVTVTRVGLPCGKCQGGKVQPARFVLGDGTVIG